MSDGIQLELVGLEGARLLDLVEQLQSLVRDSDGDDPALDRLSPTPYPDDETAADEFRETTRRDLFDARLRDAATVIDALVPFRAFDALSEEEGLTATMVDIPLADVDAWMRTLNALRLVLASRLGISDDDSHAGDDSRFGVYDWLGYRLETIILAADEVS